MVIAMSCLLNSHDGRMTKSVFIIRELLGENNISLFKSLMVSTVSCLGLIISLTSAFNVLSNSPFIQEVAVGLQQSF